METIDGKSGAQDAPRSGATAPAPFLDKGDRNVPREYVLPRWGRKQWFTRRTVMDRLRLWQSSRYQCLWVTLTSSPRSQAKRLRADFQALRKRIDRELGFKDFEYVCVDTREGHGVLHMIWAWKDPNPLKRASFYIPFEWLQASWTSLHGAFHVNVKRIGNEDRDARRLSRYIVAQYCGGQDALVRVSQSRMEYPLPRMREALRSVIKGLPERYEYGNRNFQGMAYEEVSKASNQALWSTFRKAWNNLVRSRSCEVFGVTLVWWGGELRRY
jgi:hypothetical protein